MLNKIFPPLPLALGALVLCGSSARAQSVPSYPAQNVSVSIDGLHMHREAALLINDAQCRGDTKIDIELTSLLYTYPNLEVLEFWVGSGSTDCSLGSNRTFSQAVEPPVSVCRQVGQSLLNVNGARQDLSFTAKELFSRSSKPADECDLEEEEVLYIVPLAAPSPKTGVAPDGLMPAIPIKFFVDLQPLDAPTGVKATKEQADALIRWKALSDDGEAPPSNFHQKPRYLVYVDTSAPVAADAATCPSTNLVAGKPPASSTEVAELRSGTSTHLRLNLAALKVPPNSKVPAAVVAIDLAGNPSVLSEVVCLDRVDGDDCEGSGLAPDAGAIVELEGDAGASQVDAGSCGPASKHAASGCTVTAFNRSNGTLAGLFTMLALGYALRRRRARAGASLLG